MSEIYFLIKTWIHQSIKLKVSLKQFNKTIDQHLWSTAPQTHYPLLSRGCRRHTTYQELKLIKCLFLNISLVLINKLIWLNNVREVITSGLTVCWFLYGGFYSYFVPFCSALILSAVKLRNKFYFVILIHCSIFFKLYSVHFFLPDLNWIFLFWHVCVCSLSCLQATEANSISLCSVSGGAEVSRSSQPPRPLLPPPRPGAPALLPALRPARLLGVRRHAAPRPPLLPHTRCYRSSRRPHPRAGHGAPGTSPGASEGLTAEGAKESGQVSA